MLYTQSSNSIHNYWPPSPFIGRSCIQPANTCAPERRPPATGAIAAAPCPPSAKLRPRLTNERLTARDASAFRTSATAFPPSLAATLGNLGDPISGRKGSGLRRRRPRPCAGAEKLRHESHARGPADPRRPRRGDPLFRHAARLRRGLSTASGIVTSTCTGSRPSPEPA